MRFFKSEILKSEILIDGGFPMGRISWREHFINRDFPKVRFFKSEIFIEGEFPMGEFPRAKISLIDNFQK